MDDGRGSHAHLVLNTENYFKGFCRVSNSVVTSGSSERRGIFKFLFFAVLLA
jgi:hypothetical protein